jgi:hypothetical protein
MSLKVYLHSVSSRLELVFFLFSITMFLKVVSDNCLLIDLKVLKLKGIKLDLNSQYTELVRYTLKWSGTTHRELYIHFVCLLSSIRFQLALITQKVVLVQVLHNMLYTNKKKNRNSAI